MKNKLTDLQNHLFELMEKLSDDDLVEEALDSEIKRSQAFSGLAMIAVKNAELIAKLADVYGYPAVGELPLLPPSPDGVLAPPKKKLLRDDYE